jgi:hypothetical protein
METLISPSKITIEYENGKRLILEGNEARELAGAIFRLNRNFGWEIENSMQKVTPIQKKNLLSVLKTIDKGIMVAARKLLKLNEKKS